MATLEINVDHNRCVGSTMCVQLASGVFALDPQGQSVVTDAAAAATEQVVDAASQCPMEAITVVDADTGGELFPG